MRFRREDGASAVEFALVAPVLIILVFGIIQFGIGFMQLQSIRTGLREGGRAAAVGADTATVQGTTISASNGGIPKNSPLSSVQVSGLCNAQNIGEDVTVSYDTKQLSGGGVIVHIPLLPDIVMSNQVLSAAFRCEV